MRPDDDPGAGFQTADALLLGTVLIWGVNFSLVKYALSELPPLGMNALRFLIAGVAVVLFAPAAGHSLRFARRDLWWLIGLGLLGNTSYQLLFIYGAAATSADNAALILSTIPAWVALFGTLAGSERVTGAGWLGIGLSFAGIVLIMLGADRQATFRLGGATLHGDLLILAGTLCWSLYTLLMRPATRRYPAAAVTGFSTAVGAIPLVVIGLPVLFHIDRAAVPRAAWTATFFSGLLGVAVAYICWNYAISRLGSARTALYSYLTPPIALATAWLWLGETLTALQGLGALLAIAGVVLARRHARPRPALSGA